MTRTAPIAPSRETVEWTAQQVVRMHVEPPSEDRATGRCAQCPTNPTDCRHWRWAAVILEAAAS